MKKWLIFLLLLPLVSAQLQNDFYEYSTLDLNFHMDANFQLIQQKDLIKIESMETTLGLFPRESVREEIVTYNIDASPTAIITENEEEIIFSWKKPTEEDFDLSLDSNIKTRNVLHIIDSKISFPLDSIDTFYVQPTEFIDITPEIKLKAKEVVGSEDDLYLVTHKVADWVEQNVEYDLGTLTADVVQKSSWVLERRSGVCDELTNLYISMLRSLGVPARYVSGMAYSNLNHDWGQHAWAEVYFPGKGWVPFDVTYGQFGWLDPSHIKLRHGLDSGDASLKYLWKANGVEFKQGDVEFKTSLVSKGDAVGSLIDLEVFLLKDKVAGGSYVPVEVKVTNKHDFYVPITLHMSKAPEVIGRNVKRVLLKPFEEKSVFWVVKVPSNVETNYEYYTVVGVEDTFHQGSEVKLTYGPKYGLVSEEEAKGYVNEEVVLKEDYVAEDKALSLENFKYMKEIGYNQKEKLEFLFVVNEPVTNVEMYMNNNLVLQLDGLTKSQKGEIDAMGRAFFRTGSLDVFVKYVDSVGVHTIERSYSVNVIGIPWYMRWLKILGFI